jgi:hypothetical protein
VGEVFNSNDTETKCIGCSSYFCSIKPQMKGNKNNNETGIHRILLHCIRTLSLLALFVLNHVFTHRVSRYSKTTNRGMEGRGHIVRVVHTANKGGEGK